MEQYINPRLNDIQISGIRRFFNMVNQYDDVISLTIGQPDFYTPDHIKQAAVNAIQYNRTTYTPNAGILELRQAIEQYVSEKYGLSYQAEEEIIVTVGASQAIDATLRTILTPGDEVILPGPVYPGYEPLIKLAGATPVYVDTRGQDFKLTAKQLEQSITSKTKAVILPYPSNPTGVSLTESELRGIADVLKKYKLFGLADEIYSELVYTGNHTSIAQFSDVRDHIIVINGISKSHAMTGWRIGFLLAPSWLAKHILKVHQYNVSCPTSISQYAALEALTNGKEDPSFMKEEYKERRDYVMRRLSGMGLDYVVPDGAFYIFPKFPMDGMTSFEKAVQLLEECRLALVPGDAFSTYGEGYMRLSYAYSQDTLKKGLDRLEAFLAD
ncbi:aromatic amino acid aminotransferase [Halobacillus halophilus]|uniref:Aminotransferase n=1 Tax=Halobacillus halophilus (strain ATCC 35676 / DSM 2266 / JCM 20832 / KCTC 3685 / LMG 17431 / NBRC 102448 / NCIMB 2269) TaxID=866895 RepID=I0JLV2_HALH3|nr:aminotransferase A [Halobacillus halophilus]ASF39223.1 aromatic amino acid aminotransferase [Halobacillus halophilus]CCG45122.1 aminotransferase [Halobacillus halophilus DSM 2266]